MKYLNTFKLFESIESSPIRFADLISKMRRSVKDILLDCEDLGLDIIFREPSLSQAPYSDDVFGIEIQLGKTEGGNYKSIPFGEVKHNIEHLIEYMKSIGYKDYIYMDRTYDFNLPNLKSGSKRNTLPTMLIGNAKITFYK